MSTTPGKTDVNVHVRWRKIGESVTSHYMNTERKVVLINPCECIKKLFDAAKAAVDKVPKQDAVFGGSQRAAAMRTVRGLQRFYADWKAYEFGKTAQAVYSNDKTPGKWRVATEAQLKEYGINNRNDLKIKNYDKQGELIESKFKCQLYVPDPLRFCETMPAALVFKGTTMNEMEDWLNNLQQGMDMHSDYYERAVKLGFERIKKARKPVVVVGHSLGGGLAAACSQASGKGAWTFNAAGLHPNTVERYSQKKPVSTTIEAYRHEGEVLTALQEPGWAAKFAQVLLPLLALGPVLGKLASHKLGDMPAAPGSKHAIPCAQEGWDAIERHDIGYTLDSMNAQLRQSEAELRQQTGVTCTQPVVV